MNETLTIIWVCLVFGLGTGLACIAMAVPFALIYVAYECLYAGRTKPSPDFGGANGKR